MKRGVVYECISHKPFILRRVSLFTTIATSSGSQVVKTSIYVYFKPLKTYLQRITL